MIGSSRSWSCLIDVGEKDLVEEEMPKLRSEKLSGPIIVGSERTGVSKGLCDKVSMECLRSLK